MQIDILYSHMIKCKNNWKILSKVIFRKINKQNKLQQSFSSNRSANDNNKKNKTTKQNKTELNKTIEQVNGKKICTSNHMFEWAIWDKLPPSAFLKILNCYFKTFKYNEGDLSPKLPEQNMWLLVNHIKPNSTLYWN